MDQFISRLLHRNREFLKHKTRGDEADIRATLTTLAVAQSAMRRLSLCASPDQSAAANTTDETNRRSDAMPLQLVVIGPTQVGKSTLTNILLQKPLAKSSAQAGYTVHCQGFHVVEQLQQRYEGSSHWASEYFGDLQLSQQSTLDRQVLGEYSLEETKSAQALCTDTVIWDTPDFDSIRSFDYRAPLTKAIALADLVVFVVSREKYADKTVWMMLEMLATMHTPVVMVMNKTPEKFREELASSFASKYRKALPRSSSPPLSFIDEIPDAELSSFSASDIGQLQQNIAGNLSRSSADVLRNNVVSFIREHWSGWTAEVNAEHRLQREFRALVEKTVDDTVQRYRTEYIDSDRHREVIQLALSELLVLLEVPGMAKPLSKIRSVVTWPVRTLMNSAKEPSPVGNDDRNDERRILDELGKHTTATLSASIAKKEAGEDGFWWQQMREQVTASESEVLVKYDQSLDNYQTLLHVEIDRAAQSLYQNLQQQPATLNSLRAARVTADAAAVVLAVKSGGLGAVDLVVAPAMLSLTTLLTEGALGQYMHRVQKKLTAYQEKEVRSVIDRKLANPFLQLARHSSRDESISEQELKRMTANLESGDV